MRLPLYLLLQCTWGLLQTTAGAAVFLRYRNRPHFRYHGAVVTAWPRPDSVSLGLFVFLSDRPFRDRSGLIPEGEIPRRLLVHEYGHTIQSLILGPLYLLLVGVPSVLWANLPCFQRIWRSDLSYFSFFIERNANFLGEWATGDKSIGLAKL